MIAHLRAAPERTVEVELRLAAELIEVGDWDAVEEALTEVEAVDRWEWRVALVSRRDESGAGSASAIPARASPRSIARCPASLRPSSRSGWRARRAAGRSPRPPAGTRSCRAPTPRSPRPRSASRAAGSRPASAPARWPRTTGCPIPRAPTSRRRRPGSGASPRPTEREPPTADDLLAAGSILETLPVEASSACAWRPTARGGARAGRARRSVRRRPRQPARLPVRRARPALRGRALLPGARPLGAKQCRADRAGRSRQPSST